MRTPASMAIATTAREEPAVPRTVNLATARGHLDARLVRRLAAGESLGRRVRYCATAAREGVNPGPPVAHPDDAGRNPVGHLSPRVHLAAVVEDPDGVAVVELSRRRVGRVDPQPRLRIGLGEHRR